MAGSPKLEADDLTEDELRDIVKQLLDVVYRPGAEEGSKMMDGIYAVFEQYHLDHHGDR